jgi:glycosyltransferase involved in cell wall biosynthesis
MTTVALICDIHGWAFEHIARGIIKHNPDPEVSFGLFWQKDFLDRRISVHELDNYDVLYPMSLYQAAYLRRQGYKDYITTVHMAPLGATPAAGLMSSAQDYTPFRYEAAIRARRLSAFSPFLEQLWGEARSDLYHVRVGVDPDVFYPPLRRQEHGKLRIGWVGDPDKPYKRFDLVKESVAKLRGVELCTVFGGSVRGIPKTQAEMGEVYRSLDVYLCTSDHEGLPTPAIEAALCGVPIVSVAVGIIPELIRNSQEGFIVDQDVAHVRAALRYLRDHPKERSAMSKNILYRAQAYSWPRVVQGWIDFIRGQNGRP